MECPAKGSNLLAMAFQDRPVRIVIPCGDGGVVEHATGFELQAKDPVEAKSEDARKSTATEGNPVGMGMTLNGELQIGPRNGIGFDSHGGLTLNANGVSFDLGG